MKLLEVKEIDRAKRRLNLRNQQSNLAGIQQETKQQSRQEEISNRKWTMKRSPKCNQKGRSNSIISLNGLIVDHTNRESESQQESVAIEKNGIFELKQKERKKTKGGV